MNRIRGINEWVSKHYLSRVSGSLRNPKNIKTHGCKSGGDKQEATCLPAGRFTLPREVSYATGSTKEKSAEITVAMRNEP